MWKLSLCSFNLYMGRRILTYVTQRADDVTVTEGDGTWHRRDS